MAQPADDTGNQWYTCSWVTRQHCRLRMLNQMHLDAQGSEDEMEEDKEMILNVEIDLFLLTSSNKSHNFLNSILVGFHNKKNATKILSFLI